MAKGRDTWDYLAYYLQLPDRHPPFSELQLFRTPITPIVVGLPLQLGGTWLLEVVFAVLYASAIVGWSATALTFGRVPALFTAGLLLVYPAFATLYHQASSDAVFATGLALWALLLARTLRAPSGWRFAALGVGMAVLVLIRPANEILLPLALVPFIVPVAWRRRLAWSGACLAGARRGARRMGRDERRALRRRHGRARGSGVGPVPEGVHGRRHDQPRERRLVRAARRAHPRRTSSRSRRTKGSRFRSTRTSRTARTTRPCGSSHSPTACSAATRTTACCSTRRSRRSASTRARTRTASATRSGSSSSSDRSARGSHRVRRRLLRPRLRPSSTTACCSRTRRPTFSSQPCRTASSGAPPTTSTRARSRILPRSGPIRGRKRVTGTSSRRCASGTPSSPRRTGVSFVPEILNRITPRFPRPPLWLAVGLIALIVRRPAGWRTIVVLWAGSFLVLLIHAASQGVAPEFALPLYPVFIVTALGALAGDRTPPRSLASTG